MLGSLITTYHQVREAYKRDGLRGVFRERVFWKRIATPVVMDLASIDTSREIPIETSFHFFELELDDIQTRKKYFAVKSRHYKALKNFKRGLRCFAVCQDSLVVGDVWCLAPANDDETVIHVDLDMLGVSCKKGDAYAFDMFIPNDYRGKNLAIALHHFLQLTLKIEECKNVYGFYWNDNLPALWMHRMLKFTELPKRCISRFFSLKVSDELIPLNGISSAR